MVVESTTVTKKDYMAVINEALAVALERNKRYGNSIDLARNDSIIDLCLMKLYRTRNIPMDDHKRYDELVDCINYLVFVLMREQDASD